MESGQPDLSVVILTKNEIHNLPRCLEAIPSQYRVVVVDSGSADGTPDLARSRGCTVFHQPWLGFAEQRNHALTHCSIQTEWILFVDADEIFPGEFYEWFEQGNHRLAETDVVMVPSYLYFRGQKLRFAPGYPIYHPRLVKTEKVPFVPGHAGHSETVRDDCRVMHATIPYSHYFYDGDLVRWMLKHVTLAAQEAIVRRPASGALTRRGRFSLLLGSSVLRIPIRFLYHYVLRGGFLDGRVGLEYTLMYTWYEATKYVVASTGTTQDQR